MYAAIVTGVTCIAPVGVKRLGAVPQPEQPDVAIKTAATGAVGMLNGSGGTEHEKPRRWLKK
jgi:hypothetical protein